MRPEDFAKATSGRVVRSVLGHWTYHPDPLPPAIAFDSSLVWAMSVAERALGALGGVGGMLPNPHLLIRPFLRREAVLSSRIEGTVTRLDQLMLFEAEPEGLSHPADAAEVFNYVLALERGLEQVRAGVPFSRHLLRTLHQRLLQGVRGEEKRPGEFRDRTALIGGHADTLQTAKFVPPCHTALDPLIDDLLAFLNDPAPLPTAAQIALLHYQFEAIHPFNDGNGRLGRLLITLFLCARGVLPEPMLYLSAFFEANRAEYYDHLLAVSRRGAWEEWVTFVAVGVAEQAFDAAARARQLLTLADTYRRRVAAVAPRSSAALRLVDELFAYPYLTINGAARAMGVAFKAAAAVVDRLTDEGMLREVTGLKRNRVFAAHEVFAILDAPRSPAGGPAAG